MSIIAHKIGLYSSASGDTYAVGGNSPDVVADFVNEYYRVGGSVSDFPTMFSGYTTRSDLATMVDSDGNLKWCPHNALGYSEDFTILWINDNTTDSANAVAAPDGNTTADSVLETTATAVHRIRTGTSAFAAGVANNFSVWIKPNGRTDVYLEYTNGGNCWFDLTSTGTVGSFSGTGVSGGSIAYDATSGFYKCTLHISSAAVSSNSCRIGLSPDGSTTSYAGNASLGIYVWGAHCYRTDLGGMVDVPSDMRAAAGDAFATYVPTATAAKYLQRRGNHVYNGSSWVNKGIQIETEARTNLLSQSENFSVWNTTTDAEVTSDSATGPDGNTSMDLIYVDTGASNEHTVNRSISLAANTAVTHSCYCKDNNSTYAAMRIYYGPTDWCTVVVNLSTGTITQESSGAGTASIIEAGIVNVGGGIYRLWMTTLDTANANPLCGWNIVTSGTPSLNSQNGSEGNSTKTAGIGYYVFGWQSEIGYTPSSYIPTSVSTVTRAADSLQIPAANMSASTSAMSLQMDGTITYADEGAAAQQTFLRWQTDANNYISLDLDTDSTDTGQVNANQAVTGTVDTVVASAQYSPGVNVAFNIASRHTSGAINVAKDGTAATADTTPASLVDLSARNCELFQDAMGNISQFRQWDVDLGDSGIATAST